MVKQLVSVLVHTKNSQRTIYEHLKSIKDQTYKEIEIIVVDNNSTDKTSYIAKEFTNNIYTFGPERSAQRNFAAKKAKGKYYLVPDSDMILGKNVVSECVAVMLKNSKIKAIVIPEQSVGNGFWTACKKLERSFYVGVSWMEAARFFNKEIFWEMGGYDLTNTGTEDYDLPQQIEAKYGSDSIGSIKEFIYHDEGHLSLSGSLKKKFYYAKSISVYKEKNKKKYKNQSNLLRRYVLYFSKPKKLFKNPIIGISMLFMKTSEFVAGGLGFLASKL